MPARDPLEDLQLLIKSRYSIIILDTAEEDRAESLLRRLAVRLQLPFFAWSPTKGLRRDGSESGIYGTTDPGQALANVEASKLAALYYFEGLGDFLEDKVLATRLKDAAAPFAKSTGALALAGVGLELPESLKPISATFRLPSLQLSDYRDLLHRVVKDLSARMPVQVQMKSEDFARLLNNLKGLTLLEAERILTKAIVEDGKLAPEDLSAVVEAKKAVVEREGVLEYFPAEGSLADIAGLAGLEACLSERRAILTDPSRADGFGL